MTKQVNFLINCVHLCYKAICTVITEWVACLMSPDWEFWWRMAAASRSHYCWGTVHLQYPTCCHGSLRPGRWCLHRRTCTPTIDDTATANCASAYHVQQQCRVDPTITQQHLDNVLLHGWHHTGTSGENLWSSSLTHSHPTRVTTTTTTTTSTSTLPCLLYTSDAADE